MVEREHCVASVEELREVGSRKIVEVDGREIAVFHTEDGFFSILNYCVHAGGPLGRGPLTGRYRTDKQTGRTVYEDNRRYVQCPWHDWKFDVSSGKNVNAEQYGVPTFETFVRDGDVFVRL